MPQRFLSFAHRVAVASLSFGLATLPPLPAFAQGGEPTPGEIERARTLYSQGLTQEAAADWAGALSTFEQVARIRMTPQVRYHIARCKENLGRLNEALGGYRLAEHEARNAERPADDVLAEIVAAREKLERRVPTLIIERGEGTSSAGIMLDGVKLGQAKIGTKVNVDPGPHTIDVELKDGRRFSRTVHLTEGQEEQVILDLPPDLQPESGEVTGTPGVAAEDDPFREEKKPDDVVRDAGESDGPGAGPWIVGGLGLASLAASGVFFVLRNSADSELEDGCIDDVCPENLKSKEDEGKQYATLTGITLGVGVVGIVTAGIWLLSAGGGDSAGLPAPRQARAAPRSPWQSVRVAVDVEPSGRPRVGLSGSF